MSIGVLVDFIVHPLVRYYECSGRREERVRETLHTMGFSILIGGLSTFLGVMLLVFSTSHIFITIFRAFLALVLLGCAYGLILMPVVLSVLCPEDGYVHPEASSEIIAQAIETDDKKYCVESVEEDTSTATDQGADSTISQCRDAAKDEQTLLAKRPNCEDEVSV
jgi:Patched family